MGQQCDLAMASWGLSGNGVVVDLGNPSHAVSTSSLLSLVEAGKDAEYMQETQ